MQTAMVHSNEDEGGKSARRVAIVTGGGGGIGSAIGLRLAAEGCDIAIVDLDVSRATAVADALIADGHTAAVFAADVTSAADVQAVVATIATDLGPPLVLVNNAGILRDNLLFRMTEDDWDSVMGVHLRGAFLMTRATQSWMVNAGWGRIINISSQSAQGSRGQANYSAAKAGLIGFTRALAIELGPFGITVNAIAPGFIATEMTDSAAARQGLTPEEYRSTVANLVPARRVGTPSDIANVAAFLALRESGYVSGQTIFVAGGPV